MPYKPGVGNLRSAGQMRPACGCKEAKPVLVFRDENRKIRDRF